jgi:HSP20 family protein
MRVTDIMPWRRTRDVASHPGQAPFPPLLRDVDRMLDEFWRGDLSGFGRRAAAFAPDLEVEDVDGEVRVKADLPGMAEKDFEVSVEGDTLTISGERQAEEQREERGHRWTERSYGRFERSLALPDEVEPEKAKASFANGVLTVTLPKSATSRTRSRKIAVEKN